MGGPPSLDRPALQDQRGQSQTYAKGGALRSTQQNNYMMNTKPQDLKQFEFNESIPNENQQDHYDQSNDYNDRFEAAKDAVEGTKNFDQAYDKLVKKFYHEEGANLLIPQEDMMYHEYREENKIVFNIEERQKKYAELDRKKQEKIR